MHDEPTPHPPDTRQLRAHIDALEVGLFERGTAARLLLLAAVAREHVLLIGPPGTAKSELARRLHRAFDGARYFERLLTRFSTPEELFGPLSLKALEDDRYERLIDGYLPTAGIAFLDEVFKANSAILNALLTLLNEREFDNGAGRCRTPLVCAVGASNEAPADESLLAFHDRFLLRVPVAPVGDDSFAALLNLADLPPPETPLPLTAAQLQAVAAQRDRVVLGDDVLAALALLRRSVANDGVVVSDRRWRQLAGLMRVAALTEDRPEVDVLDLWLVPYVVAVDVAVLPRLTAWVDQQVQAVPEPLTGLERAVQAFEKQLGIEQSMPGDGGAADGPGVDAQAGKLALARSLAGTAAAADAGSPLRLATAGLEAASRRRFSPVHVAARAAQVGEVLDRVAALQQATAERLRMLEARLVGRVWLPVDRAAAWCAVHQQQQLLQAALLQRLQALRAGFAALPVAQGADTTLPSPVAID